MDAPDPRTFYTVRIPAQFNRALEEQRKTDESGNRVYEGMRAVAATIRVQVEGEGGGTFYLNIDEGSMASGNESRHPPFLTLLLSLEAFESIAREADDSAMALFGGLTRLIGEIRLTKHRIQSLSDVNGLIRLEVIGPLGFALSARFGGGAIPDEPDTRIHLEETVYRDLQSGKLDPQTAFMKHQIVVEGNMRIAMKVAMATIASD
jgi:putative sterol carrier protein